MKNTDCTILVTSCDAYVDMVRPFAQLKAKFWPDCPFETVLLSETLPRVDELATLNGTCITNAVKPFDRIILTGRGKTWCQMLVEALDQITTPFVILQMNDFLFANTVNTDMIIKRLNQAKKYDAVNLRMVPLPPGRFPWKDTDLLEAPKNTAYCVSCQTGIWNRQYLRQLATKNKSAWEFERFGSFMVGEEGRPILVTPQRDYPDVDSVHKGYWVAKGMKVIIDNGIHYDFSIRGAAPLRIRIIEFIKALIFAIFPWTLVVKIQNIFGIGMKEPSSRKK